MLLALLTAFQPLAALLALNPALAQSPAPSFSPPGVVPTGTTVRVDGSSSMATINQALKKVYEEKYAGTSVTLAEEGSDAALKALLNGTVDLAAIGRSLTAKEKQQGLVAQPIARHKIAIVVGPNNPFSGNITFEQFAKLFRGELKDWSELGSAPGPIRFIDRPSSSDTRQAFRPYPVFQKAPFKAGKNTKQTARDSTDEVVQALGTDGIGYAIVDQVLDRQDVRIISMHQTLPDDPRYPFSQPLAYVYKGTPSPAVLSFLGVATAATSQSMIEAARETATTAVEASPPPVSSVSPSPAVSATATPDVAAVPPAASTETQGGFPWWLLLLPLLGLALWLWLKGRRTEPDPVVPPSIAAPPPDRPPASPVVPPIEDVPVTGAVSAGDAAIAGGAVAAGLGAAGLAGRLEAEGTAIDSSIPLEPPTVIDPSVEAVPTAEVSLEAEETVIDPPIPSEPPTVIDLPVETVSTAEVPLPAALPESGGIPSAAVLAEGAVAAGLGVAALAGNGGTIARSKITLAPHDDYQAFAEWDAPDVHKAELRQHGGRTLKLRLYDVTGLNLEQQRPQSFQEFAVAEDSTQYTTAIRPDRDYIAEIGYLTEDRYWLSLARSNAIRIPAQTLGETAVAGGATLAAGAGLAAIALRSSDKAQSDVEAAKDNVGQIDLSRETLASVDEGLPDLPEGYGDSRIVLMPRDPQWSYAYWDVPNEHKEELRRQGGQRLALRLYDVTDVDLDHGSAHSLQQYDCDELARDWYVPIPVSDRDYIAEIGYVTGDGRWLLLARSNPVRIPPIYPSDWFEDRFISVAWDDALHGKTLLTLMSPERGTAATDSPIYDQLFGLTQSTEALRVAGSLFGSLQQLPQQAVSSYVFPSGIGLGAVPGVPTLSGLTMSGIGMSGIGFGALMPPIRSRKFWLVADAELIIYGATEPDATVTIDGHPIQLNPDGTFRFHMSFQDGMLNFPIIAVAADGEQTRAVRMTFNRETPHRNTNRKDEAVDELF